MSISRHINSVESAPVLIIGAGFSGLVTACFLAKKGVTCRVIERRASTSTQPKARGINARSMELLSLIGLEEQVLAQDKSRARTRRTALVSTFAEQLRDFGATPPNTSQISGSGWGMISQENLERMLLAKALSLGVRVDFQSQLVEVDMAEGHANAMVIDTLTGFSRTIRSQWIVGADGHRSYVRQFMNPACDGRGHIATYVRAVFSADLLKVIGTEEVLFFIRHPTRGLGTLHSTDIPGRYVLSMEVPEEHLSSIKKDGFAETLIRDVAGIDDLEVGLGDVSSWNMTELIPRTLRKGRLVLAGDAAHMIPTVGAFGGNSAIQDGAELAWRLVEVIEGRDTDKLLDEYSNERRAFARFASQQAFGYYVQRQAWHLKDELPEPPAPYMATVFGFGYSGRSRWTDEDVRVHDLSWEDPGTPSGHVGFRAPHRRFRSSTGTMSTLQLGDYRYLALLGAGAHGWRKFLEDPPIPVPDIRVRQFGVEITDEISEYPDAIVAEDGILFIRPDGYVAFSHAEDIDVTQEQKWESFREFLRLTEE